MPKVAPPVPAEALPTESVLRKIRIPFIQRASMTIGGAREELFVIDLGLRGVFVERVSGVAPGEEVDVSFLIPGNEIVIQARCRVAWWRAPSAPGTLPALPPGNGLEFLSMSERDTERVRQHLLDYLRRHPRHRRFLRHPEEAEEGA
jgi:hypothetical protein